MEHSYSELYDYLKERISADRQNLPADILDRILLVSNFAIDFYLIHPGFISLITKTQQITEKEISRQIHNYFASQFLEIFGDVDESRLNYPKDKILDLFSWLLLKTRQEFMEELSKDQDIQTIHDNYMNNWSFYISILKNGIYQ